MQSSSTATSPRPSLPAATRSDAVSGTSVRRAASGCPARRRTRWYEVVGVVGNLPVTTDARVAYHAAAPGQIHPAHLQLRLRGDPAGLAQRLRDVAASVDPALHVDEVRTLEEIYREHRFGDNLGAITIGGGHRQRTAALGRRPVRADGVHGRAAPA